MAGSYLFPPLCHFCKLSCSVTPSFIRVSPSSPTMSFLFVLIYKFSHNVSCYKVDIHQYNNPGAFIHFTNTYKRWTRTWGKN